MKFNAPFAALVLVAAVSLTGCKTAGSVNVAGSNLAANGNASNPAADSEPARRITTGEARAALEKGEAFILDVRSQPEYNEGHIKGARLLPRRELNARVNELPKDKLIVTYCACPFDHLSIEAALDLKRKGYQNVGALQGGLNAWSKEGLPTETAPAASGK
jgi:rhodanese-related sulfurtransferase